MCRRAWERGHTPTHSLGARPHPHMQPGSEATPPHAAWGLPWCWLQWSALTLPSEGGRRSQGSWCLLPQHWTAEGRRRGRESSLKDCRVCSYGRAGLVSFPLRHVHLHKRRGGNETRVACTIYMYIPLLVRTRRTCCVDWRRGLSQQ